MKKHGKKFFAVLAMVLVLACAMTACAPAAASSGKTESQAPETPVSSKTDEAPVTLKYINYGAKPDTGNCDGIWNAMNEILLRDLNCTVEVEYLGSGDKSQMALKYAGNEKFDFAFTAQWFGFSDNAQSNAFYELTMDALKRYAPYMVDNLPDIAWKQASIGGKIYMLPNLKWEYPNYVVAYRGDLREKYGMEKLKTIDDLETYFDLVLKNETGIDPWSGNTSAYEIWLKYPSQWYSVNGWIFDVADSKQPEVSYQIFRDEYLAYAKKMRSFYEKGIYTSDTINDKTGYTAKFKNGQLATAVHNLQTINTLALTVQQTHPEWKVEIFNPYQGNKTYLNQFTGNGFVITRTSEHPTKVIEVVNHIYESVELQKLLNFGVEGVDYEMKDGKLYTIADVPAEKKASFGCNWNMANSKLQDTFVVKDMYDGYQEIMDDFEANTNTTPMQAFTFDKSAVETEVAGMTAVEKEYSALGYGMIADVEAAVAEYRQKLKDAGYDKVKAEYDRQVKEFMATYN